MKGAGSAERPLGVGLFPAIAADEGRRFRQFFDRRSLSCRSQFAEMHRMVVRIGAQIIDIDQSAAHNVLFWKSSWGIKIHGNFAQLENKYPGLRRRYQVPERAADKKGEGNAGGGSYGGRAKAADSSAGCEALSFRKLVQPKIKWLEVSQI